MANPTTLKGPARDFLDWPFFDDSHKALAEKLDAFAASGALSHIDHSDTDGACRLMDGETIDAWQVQGSVPLRFTFEDAAELYRGL